ncbi:tyrosine--tRNA ligase [Candidatus Aerophobetes bacterium]|uniref:Tyrosine--tRNA ligase n=1 Tax=Aerophobetes bacterium TaxID=2030807 RepID=A0A2A4X7Y6_UNCAE|nr:MAG: tyrosine--tRNA ligase [Candidatus Aerophobetes bacterium]
MKNAVEFLRERECIDAVTSEELAEHVDKPVSVYIGFDPTADSLHLGHLVGVVTLCHFIKRGHTAYFILGGATAKVGDPSGKKTERPLLSQDTIETNARAITEQLKKCLEGEDQSRARFLNNASWWDSFSFLSVLRDIGKHFRMGPMLGKDSVRTRLQSEEGLSFTEFSYQVLQGYDFHHLAKEEGVSLQMGGSDQWGNITAGIELHRKLTGKSLFGLTYPLLTKSDGTKFGKTEEGTVWLDASKTSPFHFYQYLVRVADEDVLCLLKRLTFLPIQEIKELEIEMLGGSMEPFKAQKILAKEVTQFVHGKKGMEVALKVTQLLSPGSKTELDGELLKEVKNYIPVQTFARHAVVGFSYVDLSVKAGLYKSKGETQRAIKAKGAYLNNNRVDESSYLISDLDIIDHRYLLLGAGKKKKLLIELEE